MYLQWYCIQNILIKAVVTKRKLCLSNKHRFLLDHLNLFCLLQKDINTHVLYFSHLKAKLCAVNYSIHVPR